MDRIRTERTIAIIPARGGSKRIPRKNIKSFLGKPIIAYSIEVALASGAYDEVMVSTDDPEIAEVARQYGAQVPFFRSGRNSDDHSTALAVMREVLLAYQTEGRAFDSFSCIYATAPMITVERIRETYALLIEGNYESVFPVASFSYPIQRALKIEDGLLKMFWPENYLKRSQDLEPAYHDPGLFYWMRCAPFLEKGTVFSDRTGAVVLSDLEFQDIDHESDWRIAEIKYTQLQQARLNSVKAF